MISFSIMVSRKKEIDFNDYFIPLWEYAQKIKGMSKGQFMKASGLSPQRFSEFSQQTRNITSEYFIKMMGGVGLSTDEIEAISRKPFSEDQLIQLQFDNFVKSHKSFIEELMKDPAKLQACKTVSGFQPLWDNTVTKRLFEKISKIRKR